MESLTMSGATLSVTGRPPRAHTNSTRSVGRSVWSRSIRKDINDDPTRVPFPSHRHAAPSAPWPWVDIEDEVDPEQLECPLPPIPPLCDHTQCGGCWTGYPQARFPNWTHRQVLKSKIDKAITEYAHDVPCVCLRVDVDTNGFFTNPGPIVAQYGDENAVWERLISETRPDNIRVRVLFIQDLSGPILQMLGTKYNMEPFFWSSSLNWNPSRFQEEVQPGIGDHITITLTFLKSMSNHDAIQLNAALNKSTTTLKASTLLGSQKIDTHAPLALYSNGRLLILDLLAVHLIRNVNGSTIISYHPTLGIPTTTAEFLHQRIRFAGKLPYYYSHFLEMLMRFAGQSVYWQSIFQTSPDPTFVLLTLVWHALYAWDEALENLYDHICSLETRVISTSEMPLTQELHVIRAHHLHYSSLLDDLMKHVDFICETRNPAFDNLSQEDYNFSHALLERECSNLRSEIGRLKDELVVQERRLKNVMALVFSSVNITDSRYMREMTEAAVKDSAAMKQVAYLTMVFLPASFVAGIFGMNVNEINPGTFGTLSRYFEIALPLTLLTAWIIVAFQSKYIFPQKTGFFRRLGWPIELAMIFMKQKMKKHEEDCNSDSELTDYSIGTSESPQKRNSTKDEI